MLNQKEIEILRQLAEKYMNYATSAQQDKTRQMWYSLNRLQMEKPMVLITIYPSYQRSARNITPIEDDRDTVFCNILRELYAKYRDCANLHLVEGEDIVDDTNLLGGDYLHPKPFGHAIMGMNLVEKLKPLL